ncbi:MAG: hypothetical protein FWH57_13180 [Oscillospiraceae bacterium]|nr:hypothetical protein [Oscillospiraceae bacterium]
MSIEHDACCNLAERLDDVFEEIDSDTCTDLRKNDGEYAEMWHEAIRLKQEFSVIEEVTEGSGALSLSAEEHNALIRYLALSNSMENAERKQIYFRGHMDCYAYLKKIGAI